MITRERIINAAIPVFAVKGRHGASMEDIARYGHMNKAMIYYIFQSKDELYYEVLKTVFGDMMTSLSPVSEYLASADTADINALLRCVSSGIRAFSRNSYYTGIFIDSLSNGSGEAARAVREINETSEVCIMTSKLKEFFDIGKAEKSVRDIDTDHLLLSIIGMFIAGVLPVFFLESFGLKHEDKGRFMASRHEKIIDLLLNGIFITGQPDFKKNFKIIQQAVND